MPQATLNNGAQSHERKTKKVRRALRPHLLSLEAATALITELVEAPVATEMGSPVRRAEEVEVAEAAAEGALVVVVAALGALASAITRIMLIIRTLAQAQVRSLRMLALLL